MAVTFAEYLRQIRADAVGRLSPAGREALGDLILEPPPADPYAELKSRPFVRSWTVEDLLTDAPAMASRLYLLEDCTSSVVVPGVIDYTEDADAAFARFAAAGAHAVRSTGPLTSWPGPISATT